MKPLAVYIAALHLALVALVVHDEVPQRIAVKFGLMPAPVDLSAAAAHRALIEAVQAPRDRQAPSGSVVFLGDSHVEILLASAITPKAVNHGISGQTSAELLASMDHYSSLQHASAVVIETGTNDLNEGRSEGFDQRLRAILAKVPPTVPVVLSSVPPNAHHDARPLVEAARTVCAQDRRCTFVDAFSALSVPGTQRPDGVHLTDKGYAIWSRLLRDALADVRQHPLESAAR